MLKKLLIIVTLGVIAWFGYRYYVDGGSFVNPLGTTDVDVVQGQASVEGQVLLYQLQALRLIQFDTSILHDPRFQSLVDERPEVVDEPFGRTNPFAPIR